MKKVYKIGVNGRFLTQKFVGMGKYTINLFSHLAANFKDLEFKIVVPYSPDEEVMKLFAAFNNVEIVIIPEKKILIVGNRGLAKSYWEKVQLPKYFKNEKVDLIHSSYPSLTDGLGHIPFVVTAHDAIPWTVGEYKKTSRLSSLYNKKVLSNAAKADLVMTVSNYSKKEIVKLNEISEKKIVVIYNACNYLDRKEIDEKERRKVLEKYLINPDKPYLFYLGGYDKRKNVKRLVELYLDEITNCINIPLVLGGIQTYHSKLFADWDSLEQNPILAKKIVRTGFIDEEDLPILFGCAKAFISLSMSEGFNLNLLESLSLKTPAIVADLEVYHEIVGESVYYIDLGLNNVEIGKKIVNLLTDKNKYNEIKELAEKFVTLYSWEKSAEKVHDIYLKIINSAKNAV